MTGRHCSYHSKLSGFITDQLAESDRTELEVHVESCSDCQLELDRLTNDQVISVGALALREYHSADSGIEQIDPRFVAKLLQEGPSESAFSNVQDLHDTEMPEQIGDYKIVREVGRGGMGVVYEALHSSLGRRVALKVLPGRLSKDAKALARFHHEARAVAKLHHTNIVPLFEVGSESGRSFIAMQLISGQSMDKVLSDLKSEPPFSSGRSSTGSHRAEHFRRVARIGLQAAEALAYAHSRGIIHRDVKPSNIILDESDVAWLTDFGLAKTDDVELTQAGDFVGTLRYMAPERFRNDCDARADIYALGLTLYELITLSVAFETTDRLELIQQIGEINPVEPRRLNPSIPGDLETVVLKAINKDPAARYQTAAEFADDLKRFVQDRSVKARRQSVFEKFYRWSRRNKKLAAALATVAALLVLIAVGSTLMTIRADRLQHLAEDRSELLQQRGEELQQQSEELQRTLYYSEMNVAGQSATALHGMPAVRRQLQRWEPERVGVDLRGWEWFNLYAMSHRERFSTPELDSWTWAVEFSPSGEEYVHCVNGWGIQVRSTETGEVLRDKFLGSARFVDWSPDGQQIAVAGFDNQIRVCEAETLEVTLEIGEAAPREVYCVKWSPDGSRLASCQQAQSNGKDIVRIWNAKDGSIKQKLEGHEGTVTKVDWSPDGTRLASCGLDCILVWDIQSGDQLHRVTGTVQSSCWSPDGKSFVIGQDRIEVKETESGSTTALIKTANLNVQCVRWRPKRRQVACGHYDGTVTLWDLDTKSKIRTFLGHTAAVWHLDWNPEGTMLVTSGQDQTVRVWDLNTDDQTRMVAIKANNIDWNLDGSWMAASSVWGDLVANWNPASNEIEHVFNQARQVYAARVCPRDERVAFAGRDGLKIWNRSTQKVETLDEEWFASVDWNHDGNRLATVDHLNPKLTIWDLESNQHTDFEAKEHPIFVEWSPDGERLATADRARSVTMRDAAGKVVWRQERTEQVNSIRFNPSGTQLASCENGAIVIWDVGTGARVRTLDAINEKFVSVDWSPDEKRLVSGSTSSVVIWDPETGHVATKLSGDGAGCVRWNPDGLRVAAGRGFDGIYVWDATQGYRQASHSK